MNLKQIIDEVQKITLADVDEIQSAVLHEQQILKQKENEFNDALVKAAVSRIKLLRQDD